MKILVPVDYSEHSRAVVAFAFRLAEGNGGEVVVAHVWETQPKVPPHIKVTTPDGRTCTIAELIREEAEFAMQEFLKTISVPDGSSLPHRVLSGPASEAIVTEAAAGSYDMIAMGTQSRSGIGWLVLGSVVERVLRTSPIPVVAVPMTKKA